MNTITPPPQNSTINAEVFGCKLAGVSLLGERPTQEDVKIINDIYNNSDNKIKVPSFIYGVLDGHGGYQASTFVAKDLNQHLVLHSKLFPNNSKKYFNNVMKSLQKSFHRQFRKTNAGTTVCLNLITPNKLFFINAGDSRAIVITKDHIVQITSDHTPGVVEEKARIVKAGGIVTYYGGVSRILGILSVSRGIGDCGLKPFVSEVPDVYEIESTSEIQCIVVACDGLFSVLSNEEIGEYIRKSLKNGKTAEETALEISQEAINRNCFDNVSCIIALPLGGLDAIKNDSDREKNEFCLDNNENGYMEYQEMNENNY